MGQRETAAPIEVVPGLYGLFARRIPIASTGLKHLDIRGFFRRRFDLLAIDQIC